MKRDWHNACIYSAYKFVTGEWRLSRYGSDCFQMLQNVWLDELKAYHAYLVWLSSRGRYKWSSPHESDSDYFAACSHFRQLLTDYEVKDPDDEKSVEVYMLSHLTKDKLGSQGEALIGRKRERLASRIGMSSANQIATEYCKLYYPNIIPAIKGSDEHTLKVLQAFARGRGTSNRPEIIDCFEAAVGIAFLDGVRIESLWRTGQIDKDSIF